MLESCASASSKVTTNVYLNSLITALSVLKGSPVPMTYETGVNQPSCVFISFIMCSMVPKLEHLSGCRTFLEWQPELALRSCCCCFLLNFTAY